MDFAAQRRHAADGFTQAIACALDTANTGDAKTVLLNGFPFEPVR